MRECDKSKVVTHKENDIIKDNKLDDFVNESSSSDDSSASSDIEIERYIMIPIALGMLILLIGAANIIINESISMKASSDNNDLSFAGLRNNNQNQETKYAPTDLCTLERILYEHGRLNCERACKPAKCCYEEGTECSSKKRKKKICENEEYEPCMILGIAEEIEKKEKENSKGNDNKKNKNDKRKKNNNDKENKILHVKIYNACHQDSLQIIHQKRLCYRLCNPAQCCFRKNVKCPDNVDSSAFCLAYASCDHLVEQKLNEVATQAKVNEAHSDDYFYYNIENYYDTLEQKEGDT